MIRAASLGSGSAGNGLLVETAGRRVLLDCGFGLTAATSRLARLGVFPQTIDGIILTHEHGDHAGGAFRLARRHGLPVWLSRGTLRACSALAEGVDCRVLTCGERFTLGDLEILPYTVPHDAQEPLQYVFSSGGRSIGVLTDAGEITDQVRACLSGCNGLVLECNHDAGLLARSRYPASLKRRIAGPFGHLANDCAARLLQDIDVSRLEWVVAAHLSTENNRPDLAARALAEALVWPIERVKVATQDEGFAWCGL